MLIVGCDKASKQLGPIKEFQVGIKQNHNILFISLNSNYKDPLFYRVQYYKLILSLL